MRKWMRDRLKRRKKDPGKTEEKAIPLQPAYFAAEPAPPLPAGPDQPPDTPALPQAEPSEVHSEAAHPQVPSAQKQIGGRGRRRRRGRGGRGRRGSGPQEVSAPQHVFAQATEIAAARSAVEEPPLPAKAPAPVVAQAVRAQTPKGVVVLAIGLPGSGKSSWFKRHNITPLSSDMLRSLLFDDPTEQRYQDLIFSNLRSMLKARLIARRPISYVDATNLSSHERHSWIKLAKDYGYEVQAVFFDVPLEVCLERNQRRQRVVAEDVMRRMAAKLRPPTFDEGFAKITVVRVKRGA